MEISNQFQNPIQSPADYIRALKNMGILEKEEYAGVELLMSVIKYQIELLSQRDNKIEEIKTIAEKTLNMVDYKTYFKRDNKSIKQEGFKALKMILNNINNKKD